MKIWKNILNVLIICFMLIGCGENYEQEIQEFLKKDLKLLDPDSAKFSEVHYYPGDKTKACIGLNAKNQYGGYTGEKWYQVHYSEIEAEDGSILGFWSGLTFMNYDSEPECAVHMHELAEYERKEKANENSN
jgi:hypothetical protein